MTRQRKTREFGERGIDVHELDESSRSLARGLLAERAEDQRGARAEFEVRHLREDAVLAEVVSVITPEDHDRLAAKAEIGW